MRYMAINLHDMPMFAVKFLKMKAAGHISLFGVFSDLGDPTNASLTN